MSDKNVIDEIKSQILLDTGTNEFEVLEFFLDEHGDSGKVEHRYFGMNVAKVKEVIEAPKMTQKSHSQDPCFMGTIPLRNHIVPIIDLSVWLKVNRHKSDYENVIITEFSRSVQGFIVSGVTEIHRFMWKDVIPPSDFINSFGMNVVIGTLIKDDHFIQMLDLEQIIAVLNPETAKQNWLTSVKAQKNYMALVAEDSSTIRMMLKKSLEHSNFRTNILNNGEDAFTCLKEMSDLALKEGKSIKDFIDIVIADIEMPKLDGFTLTKRIKEDKELSKLPVILYSSIITDELIHKGKSVGADKQVCKPDMDKMAGYAIELIEKPQ
ncbi:chemotaxis protein [Candidatus Magnetominusculus xianensis]|uniref:Chemotaxis protein CheV n=1 Tax=Candidatus Magnetominusculus xianensis TaxID=1748249 RepID=A0ABR5SK49_9BACT|nr:chemotaxis protein [Candidatus Magnetominusculus xianensis]KWT93566.1 chemotaxis protein CheV [Candidatus Magnetominusculus xianensis]MBF0405355.1 chemotaxis protein CheV [Nitrospirota bacterium]